MPTTLPMRDTPYGRERGMHRATAVFVLWALTMITLTAPVRPAHTADAEAIDVVLR